MVRAPCCDKIGLKRGPWSPEEDHILASFIRLNGHGNWRALPKQAGLLRCGKSCRLRWINYLRSDIRRGNFSKEEEETIITLHQILGNRWSAIAARLPGRTDNEIKNVWHTHLKKKLVKSQHSTISIPKLSGNSDSAQNTVTCLPQQCSSEEISTVTYSSTEKTAVTNEDTDYSSEHFSQIDESFWLDVLSEDNAESKKVNGEYCRPDQSVEDDDDSMDFWYNIFMRATGGMTGICDFSDSVIFDL